MITIIENLLSPQDCLDIASRFRLAPKKDGGQTAGKTAKMVKQNRQADPNAPEVRQIFDELRTKLLNHPLFPAAALPAKWGPMLLSQYGAGDQYGLHIDNALMRDQQGGTMRSDLAFTIFLSPADSYDGGELVVSGRHMEDAWKLPQGALLLYPANSLHRVNPITSGERLACVGWIQSRVRSSEKREILNDLFQLRHNLEQQNGDEAAILTLSKTHSNLIRLWADG